MRHHLHHFWRTLKTENATPSRLSASVGVGLFLGILPLYGVQTPIIIAVARLARLNTLSALAASQISLPLLAPIWVVGGIVVGELVRFGTFTPVDWSDATSFLAGLALFSGEVPDLFISCLVGDALIGAVVGCLGAALTLRITRARSASSEQCSPTDGQTDSAP